MKHIRLSLVLTVALVLCASSLYARKRPIVPDSLQTLRFQIGSAPLCLHRVEAGSFMMGATHEQYDRDLTTDRPAHFVSLNAYYIADKEVTNRLWRTVMSEWVAEERTNTLDLPVSYITWRDCQEFIRRLDSLTGLPFRLPTEAEWEYAARGGERSHSYRFAGSHEVDSVAWIYSNSGSQKHPVGQKHPNELGLFDMTGNVSEWCQDWFAPYYIATEPNPKGPSEGEFRVVRGASYDNCAENCHLSVRQFFGEEESLSYVGLRLALTLPNDPMLQKMEEDPELVRSVKLKGQKMKFYYVPAEQPYYIAEEVVSAKLWKRVTGKTLEDIKGNEPAVGVNRDERERFLELCSKHSGAALAIATQDEEQVALDKGIITPSKMVARKQKRWERDVQSIQKHRKHARRTNTFTQMLGLRKLQMDIPDDPVLRSFMQDPDADKPIRLVIHLTK